ncbi:WD_REPEATS_REGION domain-containing protein [Caerostris darwini]|uniref:WD_REPEATS_REGION domain-containing protein n=1 Tax=Caerostris darwini TaxID=1538125 RepID=A0AAV4SCS5_9ARAC|nr:WD_REPEATS_REGION domain-containing protein [Caerostris darwini]
MWDTGAAGDCSALNSGESESEEENETLEENEETEVCNALEQTKNESSICKSFYFLEEYSFIDFVDTDGEFIITAGRDHDIKVWDAVDETIIQRLAGHTGPITGIKLLQSADAAEAGSNDVTVISASEDGSIKEWSISKGTEIRSIETENVITCMAILTNTLIATGNHKGRLELHHLLTGQLYCSIMAHSDPVDALVVYDTYICTAVYDKPGSLRIWQLKWGKMVCIYNLEETVSVEFNTFTLYGDLLFLGDASEQKLHMISFMTADTDCLKLLEKPGHVQHITVTEGLLLVSSTDLNKIVHLHVYQLQDLDHLGTFYCKNIDRIASIMLVKNHVLKFILGGSALAILKLEFPPTKSTTEVATNSKSTQLAEIDFKKNEKGQYDEVNAENNLIRQESNPEEKSKRQGAKNNPTVHYNERLATFEGLPQLPPIRNSMESKSQLKDDEKYENECHETENQPVKQSGNCPHKLKHENSVIYKELKNFVEDVAFEQKTENITGKILRQKEKSIDTQNNDSTKETSPQKVPRSLSQKQKYESEKVRIIKVTKQHESGNKKHNWLHLPKRKQAKNAEKDHHQKKNCKIM